MNTWPWWIGTVLATLVSEDLTCIAVGLLAAAGQTDLVQGIAACCLGIFAGDCGIWLAARVGGRRFLGWAPLARRLPEARRAKLADWLETRCAQAVLVSRFLPGTRVPLILTAGLIGRQGGRFLVWSLIAALLWTPLIVTLVALFGESLAVPLQSVLGAGGWVAASVGLLVLGHSLLQKVSWRRTLAHLDRWRRWEFWPTWIIYLPLLPWMAWLSVRYRGLSVWTACNPGIPAGGVVGESKGAILRQLDAASVLPFSVLPEGCKEERWRLFQELAQAHRWSFPLIFKPDAGERGTGVARVANLAEAQAYLQQHPERILVQQYHPGPYEAGLFYVRLPGHTHGRLFSLTDKVFPVVEGDGISRLEDLIWSHPRYRLQGDLFARRHANQLGRVLDKGERFPLTVAGNHSQGTLFRDGAHLWTPELENAVDALVRPFEGFFIGRLDVRYSNPEAFRAGRELAVVELNGATSESTNIYDPSWSLIKSYGVLMAQWHLLYRIGAANRAAGHAPVSIIELLRMVWAARQPAPSSLPHEELEWPA